MRYSRAADVVRVLGGLPGVPVLGGAFSKIYVTPLRFSVYRVFVARGRRLLGVITPTGRMPARRRLYGGSERCKREARARSEAL